MTPMTSQNNPFRLRPQSVTRDVGAIDKGRGTLGSNLSRDLFNCYLLPWEGEVK